MVAMVAYDTITHGLDIGVKGKPIVRAAFTEKDYSIVFKPDAVVVNLSAEASDEYNGGFLSVYAFDEEGNHVFSIKRVLDGKIIIDAEENPGFRAILSESDVVLSVEKGSLDITLYDVLVDAREEGRFFGLEKCLLGQQCIKVCPAAAIMELKKDPDPMGRGRIIPAIIYDNCIEGGLCAARCPTKLITLENESQQNK